MSDTSKSWGKGGFSFNRDQTGVLIAIYEKHDNLHDVTNANYKNKTKKLASLQSITMEFNRNFPGVNVTIDDIKKKINCVRTQFFAEANKIKKSIISGAEGDDVYKPSLWCFDQLQFLHSPELSKSRQSSLGLSDKQSNQYMEDFCEIVYDTSVKELSNREVNILQPSSPMSRPSTSQSYMSDESSSTKKRRKVSSDGNKASVLMEKALLEGSRKPAQMDNIDIFGLMVAAEMRAVQNPSSSRALRRKIISLIHDAVEEEQNI